MAFDKANHYGINLRGAYYKEFDLMHDKVCTMHEMMKENDISRLFFKIKKSKTKVITVRILRYKKKSEIIVNSMEKREDKIYDYADTYKLYNDNCLVRDNSKLYKHNLDTELISEWMD